MEENAKRLLNINNNFLSNTKETYNVVPLAIEPRTLCSLFASKVLGS